MCTEVGLGEGVAWRSSRMCPAALTCPESWSSAAAPEPSVCGALKTGKAPATETPTPTWAPQNPAGTRPGCPVLPLSLSPHHGWPISPRLRQIYKDPETLVFRDPSSWRWADFTAHPRVLTVGDRTGVKMVDTQVRAWGAGTSASGRDKPQGQQGPGQLDPRRTVGELTQRVPQGPPGCGLLLFRGGAEASCQKGERVLLTQHLGDLGPESLHPMLHLICTQVGSPLLLSTLPCLRSLETQVTGPWMQPGMGRGRGGRGLAPPLPSLSAPWRSWVSGLVCQPRARWGRL